MPAAAPSLAGNPVIAAAHVPLAAVTRGEAVDSVHRGSIAVVDAAGRVLFGAGDPDVVTMTRSTLKPFQALPFVAAGGVERFGFSAPQVALLCASHSGESRHMEAVADMLARAGNVEADLQCGTHAPGHYEARGEVPPPPPYPVLAHNCSGKHSGMLAYCTLCALPKQSYLDFDHPLQQAIRGAVAHYLETPEAALASGTDGCSAPNYAVPLLRLAQGFAKLASGRDDARFARAPRLLADAMLRYPEMVAGEARSDLALMQAGRGDWLAKIGAEGVQAIGIRSAGVGIAIKIADGNKRALRPVIAAVLEQLALLDSAASVALAEWRAPVVRNYRGIATGAIRPTFVLDRFGGSESRGVAAGGNHDGG
jgi:L-asparaginase II